MTPSKPTEELTDDEADCRKLVAAMERLEAKPSVWHVDTDTGEMHYSMETLAKESGLSEDRIFQLFAEEGMFPVYDPGGRFKPLPLH